MQYSQLICTSLAFAQVENFFLIYLFMIRDANGGDCEGPGTGLHLTLNLTFSLVLGSSAARPSRSHALVSLVSMHFSVISNYKCIDLISTSTSTSNFRPLSTTKCCQTFTVNNKKLK